MYIQITRLKEYIEKQPERRTEGQKRLRLKVLHIQYANILA